MEIVGASGIGLKAWGLAEARGGLKAGLGLGVLGFRVTVFGV